ncbi:MAG: MFS transporter [Gammaproteobacteria bacterium]|nr:MFS transporter [Gammaproteobacteria bacterium]
MTLPGRRYAWLVFVLTFGLMLSDYMSRQVINAVFPILKIEWSLTDSQLGMLVSVVALLVGVMSFPIALLADRVGRVKAVTTMAVVWGLATVWCGLTGNFLQMLLARSLVGLGEAGYGGAGGAILVSVFPARHRATVIGAFFSGGLFGSVLGVALGGLIAQHYGWRMAFIAIGGSGLFLAVAYPMLVKEPARVGHAMAAIPLRTVITALFASRTARWNYVGSGLQMFVQGSLLAWLPSFFNRHHGMEVAEAALYAAFVLLTGAVGMMVCGAIADRASVRTPRNRLRLPALCALLACPLLITAFAMPPGPLQIAVIAAGAFFTGGHAGPCGAVATDVTNPAIHATVIATVALANNILGLAPGPVLTGIGADRIGLDHALQLMPLVGLVAGVAFLQAARYYDNDRFQGDA